jgi:diguanylate cyclase (GGDEF)-like protein
MWSFCALALFLADVLLGCVHPSLVVPVWNGAMELSVLLIIAYFFSTLKSVLFLERSFARVDYLTEIANARHFHEQAEIEFTRSARYNRPLSIVVADIDNFKYVNDNFGHATGDRLLHAVAKTIQKTLRRTDIIARIGGDEFAIVLPETDCRSAIAAATKVRDNLSRAVGKNGWPVTFSMGIVTRLGAQCSLKDSMKKADDLMYTAKKNGKNMIMTETF